LEFPLFSDHKGILHFSTTRSGGVSIGEYQSLNLGEYCGDEEAAVGENRKRLSQALSIPALFVPNQTHGSRMLEIGKEFLSLSEEAQTGALTGIDALITDQSDVCIAVAAADCVPVLLYAPDKRIIAAIHAGWRGTVAQIVSKVIQQIIERYNCNPKEMIAGIGPSICGINYHVGEEVANAFLSAGSKLDSIVIENPRTGQFQIDLWEANRLQLLQSGLLADKINISGHCTYSDRRNFFSARWQGFHCGRMLSGIMLRD